MFILLMYQLSFDKILLQLLNTKAISTLDMILNLKTSPSHPVNVILLGILNRHFPVWFTSMFIMHSSFLMF
jgi:hypothetical protein